MTDSSDIFEQYYNEYCKQIAELDFDSIKETLGLISEGDQLFLPFFNGKYLITNSGFADPEGDKPRYGVLVILSKYILLCPDHLHHEPEWVSFKDFKRISHFTNVNFFSSDTEKAIEKHFSGRLDALSSAAEKCGGIHHEMDISYDLAMQFNALPRISLLLLFNDGDDEFPAKCAVLFQKHSEFYLDPESLAMTGAFLARRLRDAG